MAGGYVLPKWLRINVGEPDLLRAQFEALTTHVPLLYLILAINTSLTAWQCRLVAPWWMTAAFPLALGTALTLRALVWTGWKKKHVSLNEIRSRLVLTVVVGAALCVVLLAWALRLYWLGGPEERGHVILYIGITTVSSITSLMHLPAAAIAVTGIVTAPFAMFLMIFGYETGVVGAINILLVMSVLVFMLRVYSNDFSQLIDTKAHLERKSYEAAKLGEENMRLAHVDALTELANRRRFFARFEETLENASRAQSRFAIGLVDLDGFKPVNDGYGHNVGDAVLREVGQRLTQASQKRVFCARLGGDEFAILIEGDVSVAALTEFSARVCEALRQPYAVLGVDVNISATIGFAVYPENGAAVEALYEHADYALYTAKENGRGGMQLFTPELQEALTKTKSVELALQTADFEKEFHLEFQPIFDIDAERPSAFEALSRWESPTLGRVPPDRFIRIAEKSGVIHRLTRVMLGKALEQAKTWPDDVSLSFNLSMRDLTSREAMLSIVKLIMTSGFPANRLTLEITESAFMRDYDAASEALELLKMLGVKISLDDFGIGYSSLSYVHRLPLDKIKIDRSFVRALSTNHPTRDVIRTILALCDNLQLDCVAEGMETHDEVTALRDLGCRSMQGFYFSRPVKGEATASFFNAIDQAKSASNAA